MFGAYRILPIITHRYCYISDVNWCFGQCFNKRKWNFQGKQREMKFLRENQGNYLFSIELL